MNTGPQNNAMTEIALALAMGFFSIMVLTLVSMSVEPSAPPTAVQALTLVPPANAQAGGALEPDRQDVIVIFDGHQFRDRRLERLDPTTIDPARRVILAIDPAVSIKQALAARARIGNAKLVVSSLDAKWQAALARRQAEAGQ